MSCPIVSAMKQVTQGSIIPQRMTINSILIRITEIVAHDVAADYARIQIVILIVSKIYKDSIFARSILVHARARFFVNANEKWIN